MVVLPQGAEAHGDGGLREPGRPRRSGVNHGPGRRQPPGAAQTPEADVRVAAAGPAAGCRGPQGARRPQALPAAPEVRVPAPADGQHRETGVARAGLTGDALVQLVDADAIRWAAAAVRLLERQAWTTRVLLLPGRRGLGVWLYNLRSLLDRCLIFVHYAGAVNRC